MQSSLFLFFFFNDTATTEIYTLSLHDALPISCSSQCSFRSVLIGNHRSNAEYTSCRREAWVPSSDGWRGVTVANRRMRDRKSTRLNSSHSQISYAVFCLKKKTRQKRYV